MLIILNMSEVTKTLANSVIEKSQEALVHHSGGVYNKSHFIFQTSIVSVCWLK